MHMHQVDPSSKLIGSNFDLGSQGSKGFFHQKRGDLVHPPNLTRALGKGRMSSSSSSSSVNTSKSYISDMTWPILTRLGHKYRLTIPFMSHDQIRVKGHVGVTGVKKVIFTKNATSPTDYRVWSCDSCTCISLTPSTKVMGLKIHPGSFGVTGVKKVIFTKNATSPTNYRVWSCDSCTYISLTPSTKVMGLKIHPGSFGVTGIKRSFSLKTLLLLQFTGYGHVTHVHASAWPPSTKVMGLKIYPGSFGVTGVKRLFSLKTLLLLQITG